MKSYKLSDGRNVTAQERELEGMAGEPMTVLQFVTDNGEMVNSLDVKSMLPSEEVTEIEVWEEMLSQMNYASAMRYIM